MMINQLTEDQIEKRIEAAIELEKIHFFDDLDEPEPLDFWDRVAECDHKDRTDYYVDVYCFTPYCSGHESHCRNCGVYISECGCNSESEMSGWPWTRWRKRGWI